MVGGEEDGPVGVSIFRHGVNPVAVPSTRVERAADVAVVGGGNLGLSASITLARAGRDVTLFEADAIGAGPSANGPGWLRSSRPETGDLRRLDAGRRRDIETALRDAYQWTIELIDVFDVACSPIRLETETLIDPFAVHQTLVSVALDHGTVIHERTPVIRISSSVGPGLARFELRTGRGRIRCNDVLIAAGAGTGSLANLGRGIMHAKRVDYVATVGRPPVGPWRSDRAMIDRDLIGRPLDDDRWLFASSARRSLEERVGVPVSHRWSAVHGATGDGIARAGRSGGMWWAVTGSPDDVATDGWLGAQMGLWVDGESPPVYALLGRPPLRLRSLRR